MGEVELKDLRANQELHGKVTKTELYGAFVDVGADQDGLIHISMLRKGNVKRVEDVVEAGQEVRVWVHRVDPEAGRLELTMIRPVDLKWKDIKPGMRLQGKIVRLESFGAFVDVGAERPGLVHVSEISHDYVNHPSDVVSTGDEVEVSVLDVDRKKRQIRLSMKEEAAEEASEAQEPQADLPTAMEVAMRRALDESDGEASAVEDGSDRKGTQPRGEQEDILLRTLKQRVNTESSKRQG